jgi:hypothetical protein
MLNVRVIVLGAAVVLLGACTPAVVTLTPEGERVQVVDNLQDVQDCSVIGTVSAAPSNAVSNENTRLIHARNRAAERGGNRIVPGRLEITGTQEFSVFKCP